MFGDLFAGVCYIIRQMEGIFKICTTGLMALLLWASVVWATPLVWVTDDTPGGYYIVGGGSSFDKEKPGIEIELYRMVAKTLGLDIRFERLPWNHCLYLLGQNRVDGIFPASFKSERMDEVAAFFMSPESSHGPSITAATFLDSNASSKDSNEL